MLKKKMFQRKGKKIFLCVYRAEKERMGELNCRKGIQTRHKKKTLMRNSKI